MTIVVVALSVAILAMIPEVAAAQEDTDGATRQAEQNDYRSADERTDSGTDSVADSRVVESGDSLWSIAHQRLGPEATPQQVVEETGRIYELNRERIGDDRNLILAGQELMLSPASEPVPVKTVASEPELSSEPAAAEPPSEASAETSAKQSLVLPELPEADAELVEASSVEELPAAAPERAADDTRQKAGYAVLLITFAVALLSTSRLLAKQRY